MLKYLEKYFGNLSPDDELIIILLGSIAWFFISFVTDKSKNKSFKE